MLIALQLYKSNNNNKNNKLLKMKIIFVPIQMLFSNKTKTNNRFLTGIMRIRNKIKIFTIIIIIYIIMTTCRKTKPNS